MLYPIPILSRASLLSLLAARRLMVTASVASDSSASYVRRGSFENLHNVLSVAQQWQSQPGGRENVLENEAPS